MVQLPPGRYLVACDVPARLPVIATLPHAIAVTSGRASELPVRPGHVSGVLAGRVVDCRGQGVSGVQILATPSGHAGKPQDRPRRQVRSPRNTTDRAVDLVAALLVFDDDL